MAIGVSPETSLAKEANLEIGQTGAIKVDKNYKTKDVVNYAGYVGSNLLNGDFKQVNVDKVRQLVENNAYIIDVRERGEYNNGYIKGSKNIPLSELRERINEIPKDKLVYLHCRTGQRSYNAVLALQNLGFNNVYNITGSFLGI